MRLKTQLFIQALVPGVGILALIAFGVHSLSGLNQQLHDVTENQFGALVDDEMPALNAAQNSIALLLNADRDGYKAHLVEFEIVEATDPERIDELRASSEENRQQVLDRVRLGAANLASEATPLRAEFESKFAAWH